MTENNWDSAFTDFFEAFKNYDEAGSPRRIQCLNYMVLANMLRGQPVSVFDSQEVSNPFYLLLLLVLLKKISRRKAIKMILKSWL